MGVTVMDNVGEAFAWPFHGRNWFGRTVLQGLIWLIPIIGQIALSGWMMRTIDNYRAGRRELPPAGFHLGRGAGIWFTFLIYGIGLSIPGNVLTSVGNTLHSGGVTALGNVVNVAAWLLLTFLSPVLILFVYRGGFAAGFDFGGLWRHATGANTGKTVVAAVVLFATSIIGGLGAILLLVGLLFTAPYGQAITAGAVTWYEGVTTGPRPQPPAGPAG